MAEFSKQWCELYDNEMPSDFDILEEFSKLEYDSYIPIICEGFGFIAIGKDETGECVLAFPIEDAPYGTVVWKKYNEIIK